MPRRKIKPYKKKKRLTKTEARFVALGVGLISIITASNLMQKSYERDGLYTLLYIAGGLGVLWALIG